MRLSMSSQWVSAACTGAIATSTHKRNPRPVEWRQSMSNLTIPHPSPAALTLIDIGINLSHDSYDGDRDAVIERAKDAGVTQMIVTGASLEGTRKAIELAR